MADTTCALRWDLPDVGGGLHELVPENRSLRRKSLTEPLATTQRAVEAPLARDDDSFTEVAEDRVRGALKGAPCAGPRCSPSFDPNDFTSEQKAESILQDPSNIPRQRPVGLTAE